VLVVADDEGEFLAHLRSLPGLPRCAS